MCRENGMVRRAWCMQNCGMRVDRHTTSRARSRVVSTVFVLAPSGWQVGLSQLAACMIILRLHSLRCTDLLQCLRRHLIVFCVCCVRLGPRVKRSILEYVMLALSSPSW